MGVKLPILHHFSKNKAITEFKNLFDQVSVAQNTFFFKYKQTKNLELGNYARNSQPELKKKNSSNSAACRVKNLKSIIFLKEVLYWFQLKMFLCLNGLKNS